MSEVKRSTSSKDSTQSFGISSDYMRNRQGSVVTTDMIMNNRGEFRNVHDIKYSVTQIRKSVLQYKSFKKRIGEDYFSSIIMDGGKVLIGMKFGGEMKIQSTYEFLFGSASTEKNEYLKRDAKQGLEDLNQFITSYIKSKNIRFPKIQLTKLTELSFLISSKIPICILSLSENNILEFDPISKSSANFKYCKLPLKHTGYFNDSNRNQQFSLYPFSNSKLLLEVLVKTYILQVKQYKSRIFSIEAEKLEIIENFLVKSLENFEFNEKQIFSSFGQALFDKNKGYPKLVHLYHTDKYLAVCYRYQDSNDVEYFSTFNFAGNSGFKFRFSRILQNKSLEAKDKTASMIVLDEFKAIALGTKTGKIIIHDIKFSARKFIINAHKLCIIQLYLAKDYIISISKDKTISKTKLFNLRQLKIQKLHQNSYLSTPNQNFPQNSKTPILLSPTYNPGSKNLISSGFTELVTPACFDPNDHSQLFQPSNSLTWLTHFGNKLITRNLSIIHLDSSLSISNYFQSHSKLEFHSIELIENSYLVCAGYSKVLKIFKLEENLRLEEITEISFKNESNSKKLPYKLVAIDSVFTHSDNVSALTSHQKFIISGSSDGVIKIWNLFENNSIKLVLVNELIPPLSHSIQVTCLRVLSNEKVFLSSAYDKMIKIWKFKEFLYNRFEGQDESYDERSGEEGKGEDRSLFSDKIESTDKRLIYTIDGLEEFARFIVQIKDDDYFITCSSFGNLNIWSMQTYTSILCMNLYSNIDYFIAVKDNVLFSDRNYLFAFELVINDKSKVGLAASDIEEIDQSILNSLPNLQFLGPSMENIYQALRYFRQCTSDKPPEFNPVYDKFVIFPFLLTSQHIYSFFNLPHHLHLSLQNKTSLSESTHKQSPLSIAVSKDFEDCVDSIVKYLKFHLASSPFIINFISDTSLIEMNYSGRDSLEMFYQILFIKVQKVSVPRFVSLSVNLPIFKHYPDAVTNYTSLFSTHLKGFEDDVGQSVEFLRSAVAISLIMGSKRSVDLLQSFVKCKNLKVFSTSFIRAYVDYKMPVVRSIMTVHACIYYFYILMLIIFLTMSSISMAVVGFIFLCKIFLFVFEIYKIQAFGFSYFENNWNLIDFFRMIVANILFILIIYEYILLLSPSIYSYIRITFFIVTIISFIRSISFFRLIESTQNFTHLLWEIFQDSVSFMIFMLYNTICIAFLFYISSSYSVPLIDNFKNAFLLNYGGYNPEIGEEPIVWVIYVAAVIINNWMILNFMIAVYSDKFEDVKNKSLMQSYKTKVEMAYEVEVIMTWNRENMVVENSEQGLTGNEEASALEYVVIKMPTWINKLLRWVQGCRRKKVESWVISEIVLPKRPIKEYIHMCKSIFDEQEIDLDLERVNSMWSQVKRAVVKTSELSLKVLKNQDDSEKTLKDLKKILNDKRGLEMGKEVAVQDGGRVGKNEIRRCSSRILIDMISIALSNNLIEKKKFKKNIARNIDILLNTR